MELKRSPFLYLKSTHAKVHRHHTGTHMQYVGVDFMIFSVVVFNRYFAYILVTRICSLEVIITRENRTIYYVMCTENVHVHMCYHLIEQLLPKNKTEHDPSLASHLQTLIVFFIAMSMSQTLLSTAVGSHPVLCKSKLWQAYTVKLKWKWKWGRKKTNNDG